MSPTLYTAKNNGGNDNGDSTTMVITTTMANNGIGFGDIQSPFPCFHVEILGPYKFTNNVAGQNMSGVVVQRYSVCEEGHCYDCFYYTFYFIFVDTLFAATSADNYSTFLIHDTLPQRSLVSFFFCFIFTKTASTQPHSDSQVAMTHEHSHFLFSI